MKLMGLAKKSKLMGVGLIVMLLMLCGCEKEDKNSITFPQITGANDYEEETTSYEMKYQYSEGYDGITSIINEDYRDYINFDIMDKYLSGFNGSILIAVDDTIVYAMGYGYADENAGISADMNTTYKIGDIAMSFTAEAVYKLCDEGLLKLNTKINKFFPNFTQGKSITVENLLQFSSGLPDYISEPEKFGDGEELRELITAANEEGDVNVPKNFLIDYLSNVELNFETGTNYALSRTDYYLLGIIIELVSGMSYEDYIYTEVLSKNGMRMSNVVYDGAIAKPIPTSGDVTMLDANIIRGVQSGSTNVVEMYRWLRHVYKDIYTDYGAMLRIGKSGYLIKEGIVGGNIFVADALYVKEYNENNVKDIDVKDGMIYFVFATNDCGDYNKTMGYLNNVYQMVLKLQTKLRAESEQ